MVCTPEHPNHLGPESRSRTRRLECTGNACCLLALPSRPQVSEWSLASQLCEVGSVSVYILEMRNLRRKVKSSAHGRAARKWSGVGSLHSQVLQTHTRHTRFPYDCPVALHVASPLTASPACLRIPIFPGLAVTAIIRRSISHQFYRNNVTALWWFTLHFSPREDEYLFTDERHRLPSINCLFISFSTFFYWIKFLTVLQKFLEYSWHESYIL